MTRGDLRILVCGAGPADDTGTLVVAARDRGWTVDVTATAAALPMVDEAEIAELTGRPVRTTYGYAPDGTRVSPRADALIIAPATFNTINKLALGIADTYPLSSVAEVIGRGVPTVIVPSVNNALGARSAYRSAVLTLKSEGVLFAVDGQAALEVLQSAS